MTGPNWLTGALVAQGFFSSAPVRAALVVGGVAALASGAVGVFTVLRGQSFAGHAFSDMGALGGSGALLVGLAPLWGFVGVGAAAAAAMELLGVERRRGRDVATGIVLGAALGIAALLLYLDTTHTSTTGATTTVLFGSLFTVGGATVPLSLGLAGVALATTLCLYRPLLLSSVNPEMAAAHGVPVGPVSFAFLALLSISVALAAVTVGAILSTALLIGPAAIALRVTRRPATAMAAAAATGVAATWLGIVLAYDSYDWPPSHRGWPVSFLVVAVLVTAYAVVDVATARIARRRLRSRSVEAPCSPA